MHDVMVLARLLRDLRGCAPESEFPCVRCEAPPSLDPPGCVQAAGVALVRYKEALRDPALALSQAIEDAKSLYGPGESPGSLRIGGEDALDDRTLVEALEGLGEPGARG